MTYPALLAVIKAQYKVVFFFRVLRYLMQTELSPKTPLPPDPFANAPIKFEKAAVTRKGKNFDVLRFISAGEVGTASRRRLLFYEIPVVPAQ